MAEVFPGLTHPAHPFVAAYRRGLEERVASEVVAFYEPLGRWLEVRVYPFSAGVAVFLRDVSSLLDFTQARLGGGIPVERRPSDFRKAVRAALEDLELVYPERRVVVSLAEDLAGSWDVNRLTQVVQNLVTNALKYSPEASPVHVDASADVARREVVLVVHNQGKPIPAERLRSIFEPYDRGTAQIDLTTRSVGLGLYIVKAVVDGHGGLIEVTSTEGDGTTFTVRLPIHPAT